MNLIQSLPISSTAETRQTHEYCRFIVHSCDKRTSRQDGPPQGLCDFFTAAKTNDHEIKNLELDVSLWPINDEDRSVFMGFCQEFGRWLRSLRVICPAIRVFDLLDCQEFGNLLVLDIGHQSNFLVDRRTLVSVATSCPFLEELSIRCDPYALEGLNTFPSSLKKLSISLIIPWFITQDQLDEWSDIELVPYVTEAFREVLFELKSLSIEAKRVKLPYEFLPLISLTHLDLDVGLFGQLQSLTTAKKLESFNYSYHAGYFGYPWREMDDIGYLLSVCNIKRVTFRIPFDVDNRNQMVDMLATVFKDFPETEFLVTKYWDEGSSEDEVSEMDVSGELIESGSSIQELDVLEGKQQKRYNFRNRYNLRTASVDSSDSGLESCSNERPRSASAAMSSNESNLQSQDYQEMMQSLSQRTMTRVSRLPNFLVDIEDTPKDQHYYAKYIQETRKRD